MYSIEYCHVTPENSWDEQIERANQCAADFLAGYHKGPGQKCIMIDDVHSDQEISTDLLEKIVSNLKGTSEKLGVLDLLEFWMRFAKSGVEKTGGIAVLFRGFSRLRFSQRSPKGR